MENELEQARRAADAAAEKQSIQFRFAPDWIELRGVKFYRETIAHRWVLMEALYGKVVSPIEAGLITLYALSHDANFARNGLLDKLKETKTDKIREFFYDNVIEPDEALSLLAELRPEDKPAGEQTEAAHAIGGGVVS